jgi:ABC-type Fe3+ transport system substrate-binding protein
MTRTKLLAAALAAACVTATLPASAANTDITNYSGADREKMLLDGAKKEGEVLIYTALVVNQGLRPIQEDFNKRYPGVKLNFINTDSADAMQRVLAESRAKSVHADVLGNSDPAAFERAGVVEQFYSPIMKQYPDDYINPEHTYFAYRMSWQGIAWNLKQFPDKNMINTWEDLLKPQYKGKMIWSTNVSTGAPMLITYFRLIWGEDKTIDFLKKLREQNIASSATSVRNVLDQTVAGEMPISVDITLNHVAISQGAGAPITAVAPEPVLARPTYLMVVKNAPHPHAAMMLIDYLLLKDGGQSVLRKAEYNPAHPELDSLPSVNWYVPHLNGKKEILPLAEQIDEMAPRSQDLFKAIFR